MAIHLWPNNWQVTQSGTGGSGGGSGKQPSTGQRHALSWCRAAAGCMEVRVGRVAQPHPLPANPLPATPCLPLAGRTRRTRLCVAGSSSTWLMQRQEGEACQGAMLMWLCSGMQAGGRSSYDSLSTHSNPLCLRRPPASRCCLKSLVCGVVTRLSEAGCTTKCTRRSQRQGRGQTGRGRLRAVGRSRGGCMGGGEAAASWCPAALFTSCRWGLQAGQALAVVVRRYSMSRCPSRAQPTLHPHPAPPAAAERASRRAAQGRHVLDLVRPRPEGPCRRAQRRRRPVWCVLRATVAVVGQGRDTAALLQHC